MSILVGLILGALITAALAKSKGRGFVGWFIYATVLLPIAFFHAIFLKRKRAVDATPVQQIQPVAADGVIIAKSAIGEMRFNGREVTISRVAKATNLLIHGLDGEKSIAISAIQAVQFKQAKGGIRGYLQLTISGGIESRGGVIAAAGDENTLMFDAGDQPAFEKLAEAIKDAVYERSAPNSAAPVSVADELAKFAKLRDDGLLNEDEFTAKKKQLLGS